jgi:hypothetical protein
MAVTPNAASPFDPAPDEPLTTKEGWARWAHHTPRPPQLRPDWSDLAPADRADYDERRLDYHSDLIVVNTPTIRDIITNVRRLLVLNRRQISARRGLIVTGGAGTGKTTAITQLGRAHEINVSLRSPGLQHRIPVVYITRFRPRRPHVWSRSSSRGSLGCRSPPART